MLFYCHFLLFRVLLYLPSFVPVFTSICLFFLIFSSSSLCVPILAILYITFISCFDLVPLSLLHFMSYLPLFFISILSAFLLLSSFFRDLFRISYVFFSLYLLFYHCLLWPHCSYLLCYLRFFYLFSLCRPCCFLSPNLVVLFLLCAFRCHFFFLSLLIIFSHPISLSSCLSLFSFLSSHFSS